MSSWLTRNQICTFVDFWLQFPFEELFFKLNFWLLSFSVHSVLSSYVWISIVCFLCFVCFLMKESKGMVWNW